MTLLEAAPVADTSGGQGRQERRDFRALSLSDTVGASGREPGLSVAGSEGGGASSSFRDRLTRNARTALAGLTALGVGGGLVTVLDACAPNNCTTSGVQAAMIRAEGTGGGATGDTHEGSPSPVGSTDSQQHSKAPSSSPTPMGSADAQATQGPYTGPLWSEKLPHTFTELWGTVHDGPSCSKVEAINAVGIDVQIPIEDCPGTIDVTIADREHDGKGPTVKTPVGLTLDRDESTSNLCLYEGRTGNPATYTQGDVLTVTLESSLRGVSHHTILDSRTAKHYTGGGDGAPQSSSPSPEGTPHFGDPLIL